MNLRLNKWIGWLFLSVVGFAVFARYRLRLFEVTGESMVPTLLEGEKLIGISHLPLKPGDIVVFEHDVSHKKLIKRIKSIEGDLVTVEGDNHFFSTDSKSFGPIYKTKIKFKILYRYFPSNRAGFI